MVFLWGCNLLAHFINAYLVDDSVSDTPGGLGNDQNPGSQVGWNKDLSFFPCTPDVRTLGIGLRTWGVSRPKGVASFTSEEMRFHVGALPGRGRWSVCFWAALERLQFL